MHPLRPDRRVQRRALTSLRLAAVFSGLLLLACGEPQSMDPVNRGARVYRANCIVCHNLDPAKEGGLGPAIAGSSPGLLEARVLRREYPKGYTPKRDSALMPAFPALKGDIDALAAYLASVEKR